jgi:hypothetical protein
MDPLQILVSQVIVLCPDVSRSDVERDLRVTGSAEITVNRILDGTVCKHDLGTACPYS